MHARLSPVTRFAPSPTGYLHLGHVVNAIYVWGVARRLGGRVLLRVEDHDRIRCRPEYERALHEDLAWLGFRPDPAAVVRQSDSAEPYESAVARLRRDFNVYACACSRAEIGGGRYVGRCRDRGLKDAPGRGLRVEIGPGDEVFDDMRLGTVRQTPAGECGDLLLRDRDGHWTYQFAVTVDDLRQGVTVVIRGEDLVSSAGRQIRLARMLGRGQPPRFLHHPLIRRADGHKLSKSNRDTGIRDLRAAGVTASTVIGMAAAAVGLIDRARDVQAEDVGELFPAAHDPA